MAIEQDLGFWKQASSWLWAILVPLIGVIWGLLSKRIDTIEAKADGALSKAEFEKHLEQSVTDRQNLRHDVKELYNKTDALKDHVNGRVENLRTDMHEAIGRLRDAMDKGFADMRKDVVEAIKGLGPWRDR